MGRAEAEISPRRLAVCRGEARARPVGRPGAGRADRAAQPDHGQPDRGQQLRDDAPPGGGLSMRAAGRYRSHAPAFGGGAAAGHRGQARRLHGGERRARRHGGGRRGADTVVELARACERERRDRLLDRFSRHPLHSAQRGDVLRAASERRAGADHGARPIAHAHSLKRGARAGAGRQDRGGRCRHHAHDRHAPVAANQGRPRRSGEKHDQQHLRRGQRPGAHHAGGRSDRDHRAGRRDRHSVLARAPHRGAGRHHRLPRLDEPLLKKLGLERTAAA